MTQNAKLKSHNPHGTKRQSQSMSVMALEVLGTNLNNTIRLATILTSFIACSSSGNLPDPVTDPILGIFYCFQSAIDPDDRRASYIRGIIAVRSATVREARLGMQSIHFVDDELNLINALEDVTRELDPDVLTGWELQNSSWGYVSERVRHEFCESGFAIIFAKVLSRIFCWLLSVSLSCIGSRFFDSVRLTYGSPHD